MPVGRYQVVVGNIGTVYSGNDASKARRAFEEYKEQSLTNYGRAAGESVTWFENGEIMRAYIGILDLSEEK
jgi:hypothetical protein